MQKIGNRHQMRQSSSLSAHSASTSRWATAWATNGLKRSRRAQMSNGMARRIKPYARRNCRLLWSKLYEQTIWMQIRVEPYQPNSRLRETEMARSGSTREAQPQGSKTELVAEMNRTICDTCGNSQTPLMASTWIELNMFGFIPISSDIPSIEISKRFGKKHFCSEECFWSWIEKNKPK